MAAPHLTKLLGKKLDGNDTRILRAILNFLKAPAYKEEEAVRPLTTHLTNHPRETNKTCWALPRKHWSTHKKRWNPSNWYSSVGWPTKPYIHQLCVDCGCHVEDLPISMIECLHGERESVLSSRLLRMMMMIMKMFISKII